MPELQFKGKEFVYNHHLTVPFRPLEMHADKGIGDARLDGNLIIHGDNLHALKALLPMYAGKVDCIYIDPPYNTGKEGWIYDDNVNSPMIREWLAKEVGLEDALRHDKWACMMWPRLKLLHELCSDEALLFVSIDDNEMHTLRFLLNEIFGEDNFLGQVTIEVNPKGRGMKDSDFAKTHEYLIVYQADKREWLIGAARDEAKEARDFPLEDNGGRYRELELRNTHRQFGKHNRPNLYYPIYGLSDGTVALQPEAGSVECLPNWPDGFEGCWTWDARGVAAKTDLLVWRRVGDRNVVYRKGYSRSATGKVVRSKLKTIWKEARFHTEKGNAEIRELGLSFDNPKPLELLTEILSSFSQDGLTLLDSFAGSGTTGHAALATNGAQNANWKFVLVEGQDYADTVTAERLRRVVDREIAEGEFTYCTLGQPIEMDAILAGSALPDEAAMAGLLWHTATATPLSADAMTTAEDIGQGIARLGELAGRTYWLIYRPDLDWLKSADAALSLTKARAIAATAPGNHLVFAPAKFVSRELLSRERLDVDYAPLPFALYRLETA